MSSRAAPSRDRDSTTKGLVSLYACSDVFPMIEVDPFQDHFTFTTCTNQTQNQRQITYDPNAANYPLLLFGLVFTMRTPDSAVFRAGGARGGDGVDVEDATSGVAAGLRAVWMDGLMGRMGSGRARLLSRGAADALGAAFVGACRAAGMMGPATGLGGSEGWPSKDAPAPALAFELEPEPSAAAAELWSCRSFASILAILASVLQVDRWRSQGLADGVYTSAGGEGRKVDVRVRPPRTGTLQQAERRGLADVADRPAVLGPGALRAGGVERRLVREGHDELAAADEFVVRVRERLLRILGSSGGSNVSAG